MSAAERAGLAAYVAVLMATAVMYVGLAIYPLVPIELRPLYAWTMVYLAVALAAGAAALAAYSCAPDKRRRREEDCGAGG